MPNESGTNQFAGFPTVTPYGAKAKQGMLERLAPAAGKKPPERPYRRPPTAEAPAAAAAAKAAPPPAPVQPPSAELFRAIASLPGIPLEVQEVFGGADAA